MKKILLLSIAFLAAMASNAQTAYDALLFSKQFYQGTARSAAMGNAFTSLGGDLGALVVNPAASAVYKYSEITVTPYLNFANSSMSYLGNNTTASASKFAFSNIGILLNTENRYGSNKTFNFAVAYNRLNDYSGKFSASGNTNSFSWITNMAGELNSLQGSSAIHAADMDITNNYNPMRENTAIPWRYVLAWNSTLLDTMSNGYSYIGTVDNINNGVITPVAGMLNSEFYRETGGSNDEVTFNFSGNASGKLFYGLNIGLQTIYYTDYQEYSESAVNSNDFQTGFENFTHTYNQISKGTGLNLKFGFIYLLSKELRFGASVATPTWYSMSDEWSEGIRSAFNDGYTANISSPLGMYDYSLRTPARFNVGLSYVAGKKGLISVDYEGVDYSTAKLSDKYDRHAFDYENSAILSDYRYTSNFRAGFEIKNGPFSYRGGYNYYQNPEKSLGSDVQIVSLGAGFNTDNGMFADFALQSKLKQSEGFSLYGNGDNITSPAGKSGSSALRAIVTIGFRF